MEHDDVLRRLSSLGRRPVEPHVAERHAALLASVAPPPAPPPRRLRPVLAGAFVAGALLGGTGLAAAVPGSLPEQASSVARAALDAVNLGGDDRPERGPEATAGKGGGAGKPEKGAPGAATGTDDDEAPRRSTGDDTRAAGGVPRFTEGCTAGAPPTAFTGNHGQYVRSHPDDPATPDVNERQVAAQSDCGKPMPAVRGGEEDADEGRPAGPPGRRAEDARSEGTTTTTTDDGMRGRPPGAAGDRPGARGSRGGGPREGDSPGASRAPRRGPGERGAATSRPAGPAR